MERGRASRAATPFRAMSNSDARNRMRGPKGSLPPSFCALFFLCCVYFLDTAVQRLDAAGASPSLFAAVDPLAGFDANCTTATLESETDAAAFQPCRSVGAALALLSAGFSGNGSAWMQLLPGVHATGSLDSGETLSLTLANSSPPSLPAALVEVLNARSEAAVAVGGSNSSVIDCTGHLRCLRSGGNATLALSGLRVTGSQAHALLHSGEGTIQLDGCTFDSLGAVFLKNSGSVSIIGSTFSNVRGNHTALVRAGVPDAGLLHLNNSHLSMSDSVVADCLASGPAVVHRGSVVSVLSQWPVVVSITGTTFQRNQLQNDPLSRQITMLGGAALQVWSDFVRVELRRCSFSSNVVRGYMAHGGAVALWSRVTNPEQRVSILVEGSSFENNTCAPPVRSDAIPMCKQSSTICNGGGGAIAVGSIEAQTNLEFARGPALSVHHCSFTNNSGQGGGGLRAIGLFFLNITASSFTGNAALGDGGGAILLQTTQKQPPAAKWGPFLMDLVRFEHNSVLKRNSGGAVFIASLLNIVTMTRVHCVNNSAPTGNGGCIMVYAPSAFATGGVTGVQMLAAPDGSGSYLAHNSAKNGGAIAVFNTQLKVEYADFVSHRALLSGGTVQADDGSFVILSFCNFRDSVVGGRLPADVPPATRQGGTISAISGHLTLDSCVIDGSTVLPPGGMAACASYYQEESASTSDYRGGVIAVGETVFDSLSNIVTNARACSGAYLYFSGHTDCQSYFDEFYGLHAYAASGMVVIGSQLFRSYFTTAADCRAERAAGLYAISASLEVYVADSGFSNVSVANGDGGVLWVTLIGAIGTHVAANTFSDCAAPEGGGPILFWYQPQSSGTRSPELEFNEITYNETMALPPPALYGGDVASSFVSVNITAMDGPDATERTLTSEDSPPLQQYPGLALSPIRVYALDAYEQVMTMDRNEVIHLGLVDSGSGATMTGTVLRAINPLTGAALFDDIVLSAQPGSYTLRFAAAAAQKAISATVSLEILPGCPTGLHYDLSVLQCRRCAADFLVWDSALQSCVPCAAGWEVQNVDGAHVCRLCPLGQTSSSGGGCGSCNSNTYQPFAGAACESCILDGMEGLNCDQLVAEVNPGWFAYSVISEDEGLPRAQTVKCPEGFCAGGLIQSPWSDESLPVNGSSSTARTIPSTVITRFDQCAFPRLAAEDNIMCGQCVEGFIPWGDKCAHCESTNAGMVFLMAVLSLLLLAFLIRSATLSSTAGHSVVVLYFIQTAMLEVGGASKLVGWLNIALFSPNSIGECIAPLSPYQQTQLQIVMPLILFAELCCLTGLHYLSFKRWASAAAQAGNASLAETAEGVGLFARIRAHAQFAIDCFSPDLYISATFSLLLFTYTQVAAACLSYLACVDVGGVSVVFSQPSMRCASDEYRSTLVLVVLALAVYVAGFPLAVFLFLWRRSDLVRGAHTILQRQNAAQESQQSDSSSSDKAATVAPVTPGTIADARKSSVAADYANLPEARHFLIRYSPLFSMYSRRAWFWQLFVLARRTAFVAITVTLVRTPELRFLAYSLAHLASMLLQLYFEPFEVSFFNRAELASHTLLVVLSMLLTAYLSPHADGLQVAVFVLIVPPVIVYAIVAGTGKLRAVRSDKLAQHAEAIRRQEQAEAQVFADSFPCQPAHLPKQQQQQQLQLSQRGELEMSGIAISDDGAAANRQTDLSERVLSDRALQSDDSDLTCASL